MNATEPKPAVNDILFCQRREDGELRHFHGTDVQVSLCDVPKREIIKVRLVPDEAGPFWCWHDFGRNTYLFVYIHPELLDMCFPYGAKADEDFGRGRRVRVRAEIQP